MIENLKQKDKTIGGQATKANNEEQTKKINEKLKRGFRHVREQKSSKNNEPERNYEEIKKDKQSRKTKTTSEKNNEIVEKTKLKLEK